MPKISTCILLLSLICNSVLAQKSKYAQVTYLGYGANTLNLKVDDKGNAYVCFFGSLPMYVLGKHFPENKNMYGRSFSVIGKLDASGKTLWVRYVSLAAAERENLRFEIDKDENIYVSGYGSARKLDDNTELPEGVFLIKFDKNGRTLWGQSTGSKFYPGAVPGDYAGNIVIMPDGSIFWAGAFESTFSLGSYKFVNTVRSNNNSSVGSTFLAHLDKNGKVLSASQGPLYSRPGFMVLSEDKKVTLIRTDEIYTSKASINRLVVDENCSTTDQSLFSEYEPMSPYIVYKRGNYQTFGGVRTWVYTGYYASFRRRGLYKLTYDRYLNLLESVDMDPTVNDDYYTGGLEFSPTENYLIGDRGYTIIYQKNGVKTKLPPDPLTSAGKPAYSYELSRELKDTVHLSLDHYDPDTDRFTFEGREYSTPNKYDHSFFWNKISPNDDGECFGVKAKLVQNGKEGSQDAKLRFYLPDGCPAKADLTVNLSLAGDSKFQNENDFTLPNAVVIKAGTIFTEISLPVNDDLLVEPDELFRIDLRTTSTDRRYFTNPSDSFVDFTITDNDICSVPLAPVLSDVKVCGVTDVVLNVKNPKAETYRLYDSETAADPIQTNGSGIFTIRVEKSTTFYVSAMDGDCQSTRSPVNVTLSSDLDIPNVFTPNGDGINDVWGIKDIESYPNAKFSLYNRYGSVVFSTVGFKSPFDGTSHGKPLPVGAYIYTLQLTPGCAKIKGILSIIR